MDSEKMAGEDLNEIFELIKTLKPEEKWDITKRKIFLGSVMACDKCGISECPKRNSKDLCPYESVIIEGVTHELEKEIKAICPKLDVNSFGVQFMIRGVASNAVKLFRLNHFESQVGVLSYRKLDENTSPYSEYIHRITNQTLKLLKQLGLTPMQQLERETFAISKKLRMKLSKIQSQSVEVEMEKSENEYPIEEKKLKKVQGVIGDGNEQKRNRQQN